MSKDPKYFQLLICGTYPIRNAITVDFGVSTANATPAEAVTVSPYPTLSAHATISMACPFGGVHQRSGIGALIFI